MSADVITLPRLYYGPPSRSERVQDRICQARAWVLSKTTGRSPVVLIRRSELGRRERSAFELGCDCGRYQRR